MNFYKCECEEDFLMFQKYYFGKNYTWYADKLFDRFGYPKNYNSQRYITNVYAYPITVIVDNKTSEINHKFYHIYDNVEDIKHLKKIFLNEERKNKFIRLNKICKTK